MTSIIDIVRHIDALRTRGLRLRIEDKPSDAEPSKPWSIEVRRDGVDEVIWRARAATPEMAVEKAWRALKDDHAEPPRPGLEQTRVTKSALERLQKDYPGLTGHAARELVATSTEVPPATLFPILGRSVAAARDEEGKGTIFMLSPARVGVFVLEPDRERSDGRLACVTYLPLKQDQADQARRLWP